MRVQEVFNSILGFEDVRVIDVVLDEARDLGVWVTLEQTGPLRCPCGQAVATRYDSSWRAWRHLDVAGRALWIQARLARVWCPACSRVRTAQVSWARPGARVTRGFEQQVAWLAQRMDISSVARLMRCGWDAVHRILRAVVADHLHEDRFDGLRHIGVDEVSYKRGHKYLTVVVDHDRRRVVWVGEGRGVDTLDRFYAELGSERAAQLGAVTMDGSPAYRSSTTTNAPQAEICLDPFHVMQWANAALDTAFNASRIGQLKSKLATVCGDPRRGHRTARTAVRSGQENLLPVHHQALRVLRRERYALYRDWELKEELRDLFSSVAVRHARAYLTTWIEVAQQIGGPAMKALARRLIKHTEAIISGIELSLNNGRLEGTNTRIKAIQRRGYGMPNHESLITMIYLNCGKLDIELPTRN